MDVYNAFLQADLYEVYMELPQGFMRQDKGDQSGQVREIIVWFETSIKSMEYQT